MLSTKIWDEDKNLVPIELIKNRKRKYKDVAVVIVNRDRPDIADVLVKQIDEVKGNLDVDTYVIEMGSVNPSKHMSFWYDDKDYRGKAYGHNVGVRFVRNIGKYRYYFIAMNDILFTTELGLERLVEISDANPNIGILSPTEPDSGYAGGICKPIKGRDFHCVSQCNYLGLLIRNECIENIGFLNPDFKYCWGAIHELSYKLYSNGYKVAYCDVVQMKHLGGTTYGKVKGTISRDEYLLNAKRFAATYMRSHYGPNWDEKFSKVLTDDVVFNTYTKHKKRWEKALRGKI